MNEDFDTTLYLEHNQYLSFLDLELLDDWEEAWKGQNEELFLQILHTNGMDLNYGWQLEECLHRPRCSNQVEYGYVVRFRERQDKEFEPYRAVEDIAKTDPSSTVRAGMVNSLNMGTTISDAIEDALSTRAKLIQVKNESKKDKEKK